MHGFIKGKASQKGEGYIDFCIELIILFLIASLGCSVLACFVSKIELESKAAQVLEISCNEGDLESPLLASILIECDHKNISVRIWGDGGSKIQLGDLISVHLEQEKFITFGTISIPVKIAAIRKGCSRKYWKDVKTPY